MEASKNLRRPTNWQDFETLCKKLWGEIWNCPEIMKNGRNGQIQHGVDVYGIPQGENKYYGVQCKGKDEYTNKQFTKAEIIEEIEKAKKFQPPLKKIYFATTAVKDAVIEEFVRHKNIEFKTNGLFEIHIYSWEDIVDLIDENKQTHDWYVLNQKFKTNKCVLVTFQEGFTEIMLNPKYKKSITHYRQKIVLSNSEFIEYFLSKHENINLQSPYFNHRTLSGTKINLSYCKFHFKVHNKGIDPIKDYKIIFDFDGDIIDLKNTNEDRFGLDAIRPYHDNPDVILWTDTMSGKISPEISILVGDDSFISDAIFLKPVPKEYEILVKWKLISLDFKDEGTLKLIIKPEFEEKNIVILVEDPLKVGVIEDGNFQDFIIDKNEFN